MMAIFGKKELTPEEAAAKEATDRENAERKKRESAAKAEQQRAAEEEKRRQAFLKTAPGQARTAFGAGHHVFQYEFDLRQTRAETLAMTSAYTLSKSNDPTEVLNAICREGWDIVSASVVFHETGSVSRDKFLASGQQIAVKGNTVGYYVFRRCDLNRVAES